jgi:hypothetical protein
MKLKVKILGYLVQLVVSDNVRVILRFNIVGL